MMNKAIKYALLSLVALKAVAAASSVEENTENVVDFEDENGQGLSALALYHLITASGNFPFMDLDSFLATLGSASDYVVADEPEIVTENQVALVAGEEARDLVFTLVHNDTGAPVETDAETQKQLDALFALLQKPSFTPAELAILNYARDQLFNSNYSLVIGNVSTGEATVIGNYTFGSLIANHAENVEVASAAAADFGLADLFAEVETVNSIASAETSVVVNAVPAVEMTAAATGSSVAAATGSSVAAATGSSVAATTESSVTATTESSVAAATGSSVAAATESSVAATTEAIMSSESALSSSASVSASLGLCKIPASVKAKRIEIPVTSIPRTVRNRRPRRDRNSSSSDSSNDSSSDDESSDKEVEIVKDEVKIVLGAGPMVTGNIEGIDTALAASTIAQDPETSSYTWKFYTAFASVGAVILAALGFLGYMHLQKKQSAFEEESDL